MPLTNALKEKIRTEGRISVQDYMREVLRYYYSCKDPLGAAGDFTTSPEISQIFGEMVGVWCADQWQRMGCPPACDLMELGPGRGTLMYDLLRATRHVSGFHDALKVHLVEISPVLQAKQQQTLKHAHPNISWHNTLPEGELPLLLVANEFFDALPIQQFHGKEERMIGLNTADELCFIGEGNISECCPEGETLIRQIAERLNKHKGAALVIDYGYTQAASGDTLQAVKNHRFHPVLEAPGTADITAHVDFTALAKAAETAGAETGLISQADFLHRTGGRLRLTQLCKNASAEQRDALNSGFSRLTNEMGELFKALIIVGRG